MALAVLDVERKPTWIECAMVVVSPSGAVHVGIKPMGSALVVRTGMNASLSCIEVDIGS